jgi:hypothetical protein
MRGPYTLRVDGDGEHVPSSFGPLRDMRGDTIYNPDALYADACKAAQRVAMELETPVTVVGHVGSGAAKRPVEACRIHAYRDGDDVLVSIPRSFNYVRGHRPLRTPSHSV